MLVFDKVDQFSSVKIEFTMLIAGELKVCDVENGSSGLNPEGKTLKIRL
jgi:hypothetical protein